MMNHKRIVSIILGAVYLLSALAKASDIESFANILMSYGDRNFMFIAPIITGFEFFLAICLIFGFNLKIWSKVSFYLSVLFTMAFIYGVIFQNIKECGCFGNWVQLNPFNSLLKNGVLIILSIYLVLTKENEQLMQKYFKISIILSVVLALVNTLEIYNFYHNNQIFVGDKVKNTIFEKYGNDNLIFIFDPLCYHCQNIVPELSNAKQEVIGIYSDENIKNIQMFKNNFKPQFKIFAIKSKQLMGITQTFPLLISVKNGKILSISNQYIR